MNMYTMLLVAIASMQCYISKIPNQNPSGIEYDTEITSHAVAHEEDILATRMSTCNPPFLVMGLYDPNVPLSPNTAIFTDPFVKDEIMSDGFQGKDKEYGDIDNDGLIDILYTKNNELWYIPNTGTLFIPDFQVSNAVQTAFVNVFSFRLVDWFNDGVLDLLILEDHGIAQINLYSDIHTQLGSPASIGLLDDSTFPLRYDQLIEAGDIDGDGDMDVLVSGQDPGLMGTAFLEQVPGPPPFFFPSLQLGAGQILPSSPMIPDLGGSRHAPELYNADCDNDIDLFISEPDWGGGGGRVEYFENTGQNSTFIFFTHVSSNPYGLNDIVLPNTELICNGVIMRFADFFGDGCAEAISYDPCSNTNPDGDILFYKSVCACIAAFAYTSVSQCGYYGFNNFSSGPAPLTYVWYFDDPGSGLNNFSLLQNTAHQFSTCGNFNVCLTVNGPGCGNTFCQTIQVTDLAALPPVALCKSNVVLALDANCTALLQPSDIDNGSFDDCFIPSLSLSQTVFNACGTYPVTLTATDWCGNTSTCITIVQVVDNMPPAILCPADIYLTTSDPGCSMIVNGLQATIADNCGLQSITYTVTGDTQLSGIGDASGLSFNQGVSVVQYTALDICGNSTVCSFIVVIDCFCNCSNNLIQNQGFNQGSIHGSYGAGGQTNNWYQGTGIPTVWLGDHCCDAYAIDLRNSPTSHESIYQSGLSFLAGHKYKISFCEKEHWGSGNCQIEFLATNAPIVTGFDPYNCSNCEIMGSRGLVYNINWTNYTIPIWIASQNRDVMYIKTVGNQYDGSLIDNICVQEVFYFCCGDEQAFIENTDNATNTYPDPETREGVFEVGNLMECNTIDYINWGDGSVIDGPIFGNTILRHTYAEVGSYEVQYQVREIDPQDTSQVACFVHIFSDDIVILPDTCFCGDFSNLFFRSGDNAEVEVFCGSDPTVIECPALGQSILFTGLFYCNGNSCDDQIPISWILSGPGGTQTGTSLTDPFFNVQILPSYISQNGEYTLSLSGHCGNQSCPCIVKFIVDCPDLCPCGIPELVTLEKQVSQGLVQMFSEISCQVCFTPVAISDCEIVEWFVGDTSSFPIGASQGQQSICHTFPMPGSYTVVMKVSRQKSDGSLCASYTKAQEIQLICQPYPSCGNTIVENANFNEGAIIGGLNSGGTSHGWEGVEGNPFVANGTPGSMDTWSIRLQGNHDFHDVLRNVLPFCLDKKQGKISLRIGQQIQSENQKAKPQRHSALVVQVTSGTSSYIVGTFLLNVLDSSDWMEVIMPYDLTEWLESIPCPQNPGKIEVQLEISVTNALGSVQGGPFTFSQVEIDKICLDETVAVNQTQVSKPIRITPNPNGGEFVIEFPQPAVHGMFMQIIGLTGQVLMEKNVEAGTVLHHMDASGLPQGIYFLQIVANGLVLSVDKFVKL